MSLGQSYELVGRILAGLVMAGLRAQTLKPADFGIENRGELQHFIDVVNWLRNEGLVTTGSLLLNGIYQSVQLTARGIAAVESGSFNETTGKSVRETVEAKPEGGLASDVYGKIGSFVGGLLGGLAQSAS